jgi:hypothetical protein
VMYVISYAHRRPEVDGYHGTLQAAGNETHRD